MIKFVTESAKQMICWWLGSHSKSECIFTGEELAVWPTDLPLSSTKQTNLILTMSLCPQTWFKFITFCNCLFTAVAKMWLLSSHISFFGMPTAHYASYAIVLIVCNACQRSMNRKPHFILGSLEIYFLFSCQLLLKMFLYSASRIVTESFQVMTCSSTLSVRRRPTLY